jgi:hypothetical protein
MNAVPEVVKVDGPDHRAAVAGELNVAHLGGEGDVLVESTRNGALFFFPF